MNLKFVFSFENVCCRSRHPHLNKQNRKKYTFVLHFSNKSTDNTICDKPTTVEHKFQLRVLSSQLRQRKHRNERQIKANRTYTKPFYQVVPFSKISKSLKLVSYLIKTEHQGPRRLQITIKKFIFFLCFDDEMNNINFSIRFDLFSKTDD